jgi:hypothetical protein
MKHKLFDTFGIVILGLMGVTTGAANAQTTAPGPYYPNPSWDQKLQCDTQATCPRFIVLSDWGGAAVLDRETGLVWEKSPTPVTGDWFSSQDRCTSLTKGGRLGWRLPTLQELERLVDPDPQTPTVGITLPAGNPFGFAPSLVWSATISFESNAVGPANEVWAMNFRSAIPSVEATNRPNGALAWCVRGGQGVTVQ